MIKKLQKKYALSEQGAKDLTPPIAISSFASTETLSFTPDNINADRFPVCQPQKV